jgi:glycosyltransferase involved in cell wall biosynthesis
MTLSPSTRSASQQRLVARQASELKRVLFVLGLDPAGKFGSIEEQALTLSRSFSDRGGLFVPVFLRPLDSESANRYAEQGLAVESLDLRGFRIHTLMSFLKLIRNHHVELVHWNFYHPVFNPYLWLTSLFRPGVQHLYTDHISRLCEGSPTRPRGRIGRLLKGGLYSRYRSVLCVSDYVLGTLRELPWVRLKRIHHFVNTDRFRPDPEVRSQVRHSLGVGEEFVIIAVAHLIKEKGIDVAIRALASLAGEAVLWIVGEGPERGSLEAMARDLRVERRVRFLGPRSRVEPFFQSADCFVCPSRWAEAAGLVNLEAMSCGLPVVASHVGGIPEFVVPGETGFLCTPGDAQEFADRLRDLLDSGQLRRQFSHKARTVAEQRFAAAARIDDYFDVYCCHETAD